MTTPFDQQPQPVPPSEGTNDAPEDRANAPTVPNTVPAGQPNVASDGATTSDDSGYGIAAARRRAI